LGFDVDEPERVVLNALLAEDQYGKWAALESAIICGRQNLKTWALEMTVLYDAFLRDVKRVVWTSHRFKTTQQAFADLEQIIDGNDELRALVRRVRHASGDEGFELTSGVRIDFLARTSGGGRGLTGDTVILDEALFLQPAMMGALLPTLSARPDPHVRYGSSPGIVESDVLRSLRDRGRAGNDPSLSYVEYSSEREDCSTSFCRHELDAIGCQLDDEEKWAQANPALGRRISVEYVRQERRALPIAEFMRERLGWWEDPPSTETSGPFPVESWIERLDAGSQVPNGARLALAIDTSWDRQTTWIAAAAINEAGTPHVEVIATNFGSDWVEEWLSARVETLKPLQIGMQSNNAPVSSLIEPLQNKFGDIIEPMNGQDVARACGAFYDAITKGTFVHTGQAPLDDAVRMAVTRVIGDSWLLDRKKSPIDIAPLLAAVEALYLLQTTPDREPKKPGRLHTF
jgi:phage terminase large subunit-like protein